MKSGEVKRVEEQEEPTADGEGKCKKQGGSKAKQFCLSKQTKKNRNGPGNIGTQRGGGGAERKILGMLGGGVSLGCSA